MKKLVLVIVVVVVVLVLASLACKGTDIGGVVGNNAVNVLIDQQDPECPEGTVPQSTGASTVCRPQ